MSSDANSRVWERTEYELAPDGTAIPTKHHYTEIQSGLNYKDPATGEWQPSKEEIDIQPGSDGASAIQGQHQTYFPGDIFQGVIKEVTPDGLQLQSRPVGLFYADDTNSVLIAILTNSVGEIVSSNQVVYWNAFEGANASIRYTYSKSGFEQDVIVQGQLPDPAALGLDPARARLGVLTVFFDTNNPVATPGLVDAADGMMDWTLAFGSMEMGHGRAFSIGETDPSSPGLTPASRLNWIKNATSHSTTGGTHTYKHWFQMDGRNYLIEEVPYRRVAAQLEQLPPATGRLNTGSTNLFAANSFLSAIPARLLTLPASGASAKSQPMRLSRTTWDPSHALVLDYVTVNSGGNYTFQGDSTFFVTGPCYFNNVIIEGGTVIKYENMSSLSPISIGSAGDTATAFISVSGTLTCNTSTYRPAIFTAADDNTVGDTISGSTGNPSGNFYANPAIYSPTAGANISLSNVRIFYAEQGVWVGDYGSITLSDSQVSNCQLLSVLGWGDGYGSPMTLTCNNCLYSGPYYGVLVFDCGTGGDSYNLTNCTLNSLYYPIYAFSQSTYYPNTINAVNSIFANCSMYLEGNYSLQGSYNGFYSVYYYGSQGSGSSFGSPATTTASSPFQTVGAGSFYLATSTFRGLGTTSIGASLVADLAQKTTHPPTVYSSTNISTLATLSPQVARDTNSSLDLGYHYDALDYAFGGCDLYSNLNVSAGTAIGFYQASGGVGSSGQPYSISLNNGAVFNAIGTAVSPVWITFADSVQEGGNGNWTGSGWMGGFMLNGTGSGEPQLNAIFTKMYDGARQANVFRDNWDQGECNFQNSEFWSGGMGAYDQQFLNYSNCLFFRHQLYFFDQDDNPNITIQNCTFYDGFMVIGRDANGNNYPASLVTVENTSFDGTAFAWADPLNSNTNDTVENYNAYNTNNLSWQTFSYPYGSCYGTLQTIGTDSLYVTNYNWQTSRSGNFYLPPNSPLINAGDLTADQLGLFYFTTQTNQAFEGFSVVDIGYHYVAANTNGVPFENQYAMYDYLGSFYTNVTSGDGISDAWEEWLGLNPQTSNLNAPSERANYGYTLADWLDGVTGIESGGVALDPEGNVTSVSQ